MISDESEKIVETLESEVKKFANELTYWAKYLAEKILSGNAISDNDIDASYSFLLEELNSKRKQKNLKLRLTITQQMQEITSLICF